MSKPIPFSTEMVRAILDGRKTQTRRVVKPQPENVLVPDEGFVNCEPDGTVWGRQRVFCGNPKNPSVDAEHIVFPAKCPYPPGTILWVKETWQEGYNPDNIDKNGDIPLGYCYKASNHDISAEFSLGRWRSPRFMPKAAARLWLEVKNVRVERIKEISNEDILAEGINDLGSYGANYDYFANEIWNPLYAKRGYPWENNDWVFVYEFMRRENYGKN